MYSLASDEKASLVMAYTQDTLVRGDVVTKENVRVSTWLRTDGAPEYIHMFKPQLVILSGSPVRSLTYSELYLSSTQAIGFHLVPPAQDPLDYDTSEMNRIMQPVAILVGTFVFKGNLRVSSQVDLGTSFTTARIAWMSIYDVEVTNPYLPQMGVMRVPMLLVRPNQVSFALQAQ